jgi:predicted permease
MFRVLEQLRLNFVHSARALRRARLLSASVVGILALGVGGNVAVLSVLDRLLFRAPSGVSNPDRVRRLYANAVRSDGQEFVSGNFSVPDFVDLARSVADSADVAAYSTSHDVPLTGAGVRIALGYVSPRFFTLLGVRPERGRLFGDDELSLTNASPVAVVSHALWARLYGSDSSLVGRRITVAGDNVTVIGVLQPGFEGITLDPVDVWLPLGIASGNRNTETRWDRDANFLELVARLREGAHASSIERRMTRVYQLAQQWKRRESRIIVAPILIARGPLPLLPQQEKSLKLATRLYAVSLAVLLVAALNVASLLMLRSIKRRHEMAARMAVGASHGHLFGLLAMETLMLAVLAGVAAALVGTWGAMILARQSDDAVWAASGLNIRMLLTAMTTSLLAAFGAGFFPARLTMKTNPMDALRLDSPSGDAMSSRLRSVLLVGQTALAVALITSAGTFLVSLRRVGTASLGFDHERIVSISLRPAGPPQASLVNDALAAVRALPGVDAVANSSSDPFPNRQMIRLASEPGKPTRLMSYNLVDAGFFETTGVKALQGRLFTPGDDEGSDPVAIVTRTAAKTLWGTPEVLGRCVFGFSDPTRCRKVVGIIEDLRGDLAEPPVGHCLIPLRQVGRDAGGVLLVRTRHVATDIDVAAIRARLASMPPTVSEARITRPGDRIERQLLPLRRASLLVGLFGVLTLVAVAGGVYGSVGYEISLHSRELGVRMALGATSASLVRSLLGVRLRHVGVGIVLGGFMVVLMGPFLQGFLFDQSRADLAILALVSATILMATVAASLKPALQIASIDPAASLRSG